MLVLAAAALFVATRVVLHLSGDPFFDPDSYKYLSGADSLLRGRGLSPLFDILGGTYHRPANDQYDPTGVEECMAASERWRPIIW